MSNEPSRKSRSRAPLQFFVIVGCIFAGFVLSKMTKDSLREREGERWASEFATIGVSASMSGAKDRSSSIFGSVPILGDILTHRSSLNFFVDDPAELDPALEMGAKCPLLARVWVQLNVFDRSVEAEIQKKLPGMSVQFYTL